MFFDIVQPTRAAVLARFRVARVRYGDFAQGRGESQRTLARETGLRVRRLLGDGASPSVLAPGHGSGVTRILPLAVRSDEQSGTAVGGEEKNCKKQNIYVYTFVFIFFSVHRAVRI